MTSQILFGLVSMLLWAISDIIAASAVRKSGTGRVLFYSQLFSVVFALIAAPAFLGAEAARIDAVSILLLSLCGLLNAGGFLFFYRALERGKISIAVPLGYGWSIVTAVLSVAFLAERPSRALLFGSVLVVLGGVISELKLFGHRSQGHQPFSDKGTYQVVLSVLLWGVCYALFDSVSSRTGSWFLPVLILRLVSLTVMVPFLFRPDKKELRKGILVGTALIGLFELGATLSYSVGISIGYSSVVAPIAAGAPAIVVAYSLVFLKEKVSRTQLAGIMLVLLGLIIAAFAA
ncbi:MAG: DMT family transporter [archaeon]